MNSLGFFHRDIKPENLLVRHTPDSIQIKVADFGLARSISNPPFTHYVSTRWYRAPEVLLQSYSYGPPIDVFACGLILCELYTLRPLFGGTSEMDQISKMAEFLGSPEFTWENGMELMKKLKICLPDCVENISRQDIENKITKLIGSDKHAADLICGLIQWNPEKRLSVDDALEHHYFIGEENIEAIVPAAKLKESSVRQSIVVARGVSAEILIPKSNDEDTQQRCILNHASTQPIKHPLQNATPRGSVKERTEQPNEFCEYINAIATSSDVVHNRDSESSLFGVAAAKQNEFSRGPLQPNFNPSTGYKPRKFLSDAIPYQSNLHSVTQTITKTTKRRVRSSFTKSSARKRTSEKPRWLLSNQNMGKRAIEVRVGHSLYENDALHEPTQHDLVCQSERVDRGYHREEQQKRERDSVWNPF